MATLICHEINSFKIKKLKTETNYSSPFSNHRLYTINLNSTTKVIYTVTVASKEQSQCKEVIQKFISEKISSKSWNYHQNARYSSQKQVPVQHTHKHAHFFCT